MGYTVERQGFINFNGDGSNPGLAQSLMTDLAQSGGMSLVSPASIQSDTLVAVFESSADMDPLHASQKWRLRIECDEFMVKINVATELQIPADGSPVTKEYQNRTSGNLIGQVTERFESSTGTGTTARAQDVPFLAMDYFYKEADPGSGPLSYRLSVCDHGIAFCVWKDGFDDAGDMFAWFVVQRPVDPADGTILIDQYSPVFCVHSTGGGGPSSNGSINANGIRKFVVREEDVLAPTQSFSAVVASEDSNPIMNPMRQVSISVDNKYMLTFPHGLNTPKRTYKHELDMLAYVSADVISQDSDVDITVFGEGTPRKYKAMNANGPYNTCMRILLLAQGAGIPAA